MGSESFPAHLLSAGALTREYAMCTASISHLCFGDNLFGYLRVELNMLMIFVFPEDFGIWPSFILMICLTSSKVLNNCIG